MRDTMLAVVCFFAIGQLRADEVAIGTFESSLAGWSFSNGPEFPGARGVLERTAEAAHSGRTG